MDIVGRGAELASIRAFVGHVANGPTALVIDGEVGVGKSMLWLAGVAYARTRGLRVLASRPAEAERSLAHAGLGDLFEDVLDEMLPLLPTPRRRALEIATLRVDVSGDPADQRALAVAVRDVLECLSEREPVVVAIDDVQWFDRSSSTALAFALRRLGAHDIRILLARRTVGANSLPAWIRRFMTRRSNDFRLVRSAQAHCTYSCVIDFRERSRDRRCCAFTSGRAGIRSSPLRSRAVLMWTPIHSSLCRCPKH